MWRHLNPFVCLLSLFAAFGGPAAAQTAARTTMKATERGLVRVHDRLEPDAATPRRVTRPPSPAGTTLWSFDHDTATADGVAIDGSFAWSSWRFTGSGLRVHAITGDGTPALEFAGVEDSFAGVDTARGADRSLFIESGSGLDDYWVHSFTSQSAGTPDWSFSIPLEAPLGPVVSFKNVAVSYDGSTAALALHDTGTGESTLYVFDAETGEITLTWTVSDWMLGVDLTDDGSLALVTHTQLATVVDTATGEIVFQTSAPTFDGYYRISGDGSVLVLASNELSVLQADGGTYEEIIHLAIPESAFDASAIVSRDGSTVAAFAKDWGTNFLEAELYVYDVATAELLGTYAVSGSGTLQGNFVDAAASDDGSVLAFASWGTELEDWPEVMVFNRDAELIGEIPFVGSAYAVDVSADGQYVVGGAKAVHANDFGNGGRIELIEIDAGGAELAFDPSSLAFGDVEVGTTSPPQSATLQNTGDVDATGLSFGGLPAEGFEADTGDCGDTLPAGESCTVSVTFTPPVEGPTAATLSVESTEGVAADLGLSGNGVEAGEPVVEITPEAFTFEVSQGESDSETLSIGNVGDADLTWSVDEADDAVVVPGGAPYRYGLAEMPAFHAPVGGDRAAAARTSKSEAAGPRVLPAPQPAAIGSFTEGFDDITQLPGAGWAMINNSEPTGPSSWFQGNESIFPSHEGAPDAYIAVNYESTAGNGDISNWLLTPEVTIVNGTTACFWTRTSEQFEEFYDRLEVRMSIAGDSTDVGTTAESVGDFTDLLLSINPDLLPNEYPEEWTEFCVTVRERSRQPVTGRFAFRYWVTDSGPDGSNGDYVGIDTVSVTRPGDGAGCANPADIPWLAADPTSGTTAPGASEPVTVTVDTTGLDVGEHTARLCVTTNDPSAPLVEVPVDLTVVGETEEATFEGLGDLPGGITESWGYAVSADGSVVVGYSSSANGLSEAFRWQDGEMEGLGDLAGGDFYSRAFGISADGSVIVGHSSSSDGTEAFRWESGALEGLGDLEGGGFSSTANAASADGSAVVGLGISENGGEAFRWAGGGMEGLGDLPGGSFGSSAFAISADGSVVVGQSPSENGFEAFRWEDGAMEGLGDLPGGIFLSSAEAVTSDGSVVVGYSGSGDGTEACRWANGEVEGLGDLPGGAFSGFAYGVSADGAVVVGHSSTADGNQAFIWTATQGMRRLQEVLEEDYGLDLTGWVLWSARGISDDSTVIVGHGENPNGDTEGWRAFLGEPTAPLTW